MKKQAQSDKVTLLCHTEMAESQVGPQLFLLNRQGKTRVTLYFSFRNLKNQVCLKNLIFRASLVAQWLRIYLPMQGTRVRALVREDPTCCGAMKPMSHNY